MTGADPSRATGYVLLSGLAWGCLVTTFQSFGQPPLELSLAEYFTFYSRILLHYCAGGVLLAWLTSRISSLRGRFAAWISVVPAIAAAMAVALLIDRLSIAHVPFWRNDLMAAMAPRPFDLAAHLAWVFGVYGGLYVATFFFFRREALTRERLRIAELARTRADVRMDRALADDKPMVPPDMLLRALSELARRYGENDRRADRLLDMLVRLLRSASAPAGTGGKGKSRQKSKAELAASLAQLSRELGVPSATNTIEDVAQQETDDEHVAT